MLEIHSLCCFAGKKKILDGIDFSLTPNTLTAVVGRNGCGKSTLVSCINRTRDYTGEILFSGKDLALMPPRERAQLIAVLPQLLKSSHIKVHELISFGRNPYIDLGHHLTDRDVTAIKEAAEDTGVSDLLWRYTDELSGGERQKAYLAMILAQDTKLIVLDEPTTYMDMTYAQEFMTLLCNLKSRHRKTLLVVMHDLNQAVRFSDSIIVMENASMVFCGRTKDCLECNIIESTFGVVRHKADGRIFFSAD